MHPYADTDPRLPASFSISCTCHGQPGVVYITVLPFRNPVLLSLFIHVWQMGNCTTDNATAISFRK